MTLLADAIKWIAGLGLLFLCWEFAGQQVLLGKGLPPLTSIISYALEPNSYELLTRSALITATSAIYGFVIGSIIGWAIACTGQIWPLLKKGLDTLSTFVNAIPLIALGPLLIVTVGEQLTPMATAALAVFFTVFVAVLGGFEGLSNVHRDVIHTYGVNRWRALVLVLFPNALPSLIDGLKLAASSAVLGAILGEWFGAQAGLGVLIVSSMQNFQIYLLWSAAFLGTAMSAIGFLILALVQKKLLPRFGW